MIKLEISMGKAHANIHNAAESVMAYQSALKILQEALVADEMEDRILQSCQIVCNYNRMGVK